MQSPFITTLINNTPIIQTVLYYLLSLTTQMNTANSTQSHSDSPPPARPSPSSRHYHRLRTDYRRRCCFDACPEGLILLVFSLILHLVHQIVVDRRQLVFDAVLRRNARPDDLVMGHFALHPRLVVFVLCSLLIRLHIHHFCLDDVERKDGFTIGCVTFRWMCIAYSHFSLLNGFLMPFILDTIPTIRLISVSMYLFAKCKQLPYFSHPQ